MLKNTFDEGFNLELVETAFFDGILEIPRIEPPEKIIIPPSMIPYSKRDRSKDFSECVVFYEHDINFSDIVRNTKDFVEDLLRFSAVVTPDNSLYRNAPLLAQMANVYRNRAIGHFLQKNGAYVITNVRWGDERSYSIEFFLESGQKIILPERFAFLGAPKKSVVSIGTYGCVQSKENKYYFREGLEAMLDELMPEVVLVYGSMPKQIFSADIMSKTNFVLYPDWISQVRKKVR